MDQAAAAWYVLTSPRRAEVMVGPAGTGKTITAIEMARAWQQAGMGPVVALTASSNARNVLREEAARRGVAELACYNTAEWLGHAQGAREARDPIGLAPGTLITLDEASMMSIGDLAAVLRRAAVHGAKVVVTGDPMQLQAVEGGGGMALLTRHLGYVQLSEASRFRHGWERQATLRLRDGDVTVLTDYRLHDRLHVGPGEDMLEDAARAYLHDRLAGKDTLLMAGTEAMAAELSRRVREDLIRWGIVSDGPAVRLRDGAQASAGDWIMARKNDATMRAGQRGRALVNRDILRLVDADPHGTGHVGPGRSADRTGGVRTGAVVRAVPGLPVLPMERGAPGVRGHVPRGGGADGRFRDLGVQRGGGPAGHLRAAEPRPGEQRGVRDRRMADRRPEARAAARAGTRPGRNAWTASTPGSVTRRRRARHGKRSRRSRSWPSAWAGTGSSCPPPTRGPRNGPTPIASTCSACSGSTSPATRPSTGTRPPSAPP